MCNQSTPSRARTESDLKRPSVNSAKFVGKLVRPTDESVVVPITENAVSATVTAQSLTIGNSGIGHGRGPGPANCYPTDYPVSLDGLLLLGTFSLSS